ncbi:MAG: papain-like cysteine protease family protein [Pyrinomonadaceae bacterium]
MFNVAPAVNPRSQVKSSTCWLSALEMMFDWKYKRGYNYDYSAEILNKMDASFYLNVEYIYKNGIAPGECRETAKMLGLFAAGGSQTIPPDVLEDLLRRKGPVWISGRWLPNSSHAVVITGCEAATGKIKYIDPLKNFTLTDSDGSTTWLDNRGPAWTNCDAGLMYWM